VRNSQQKGDALEAAVEAIEGLILRSSPNVKDKSYLIESKKIITVDGVHHEIDLFVTFDLGPGYTAVYIFECKNWQDAVGKNEIIVFAEKIAAARAQHGFFIAKSFTADAKAQADKEPRIKLVLAIEHDPVSTIVPFGYHSARQTPTHVRLDFKVWGPRPSEPIKLDMPKAVVTLNGTRVDFLDYMNVWATEAMNESTRTFPSGTLAVGIYQREVRSERAFDEGVLTIDGNKIRTATITVQFDIILVRPAIKSHFEISGRGRVISFEEHKLGDMTMHKVQFTFAGSVPADEDEAESDTDDDQSSA
jgi:Restriction endonuclease